MLRISVMPAKKDETPSAPSSEDPFNTEDQPQRMAKYDVEKADQLESGYLGPEHGPFECDDCEHWIDPNACELVSGVIAPKGCCNLFRKAVGKTETVETPQEEAQESPEEEATEVEPEGSV